MASQIVYLDFDGEFTAYNGEILTIENVQVNHSLLSRKRIENILSQLNEKYSGQNVVFVTERPESAGYSTIYIGKTTAFDAYGNFAGIAETVDHGNTNPSDNAFVMLDSSANDETIISTISHETDHLLGTLDHGGDGMARYAADDYYYYYVSSGVTSSGVVLSGRSWWNGDVDRELMYVSNGGVANSTWVYSLAGMYIFFGGVVNSTTVLSDGIVYISGGVANDTTISGGSVFLYTVGVANETTVNYNGNMYISGGVANETTVSGGSMFISFGGVANNTTVNSYGDMYISSGGVANSTTVNSRGFMSVSSGGTALLIKENGGYVDVAEGANVTFAANTFSNVVLSYGCSATVHSGTIANNTTVKSSGSLYIYSGGVANETTVSGGYMSISSGGTALLIKENGGYVNVADGANVTFAANTFSNVVLYYASATVHSGTIANNTTVNYSGYMSISSGGVANSTTVFSRGYMSISSGGVANSTTVNDDGGLSISSGGVVNNTTVNSAGRMYISSGGEANSTTVNSYGNMYISSGGVANSTTVNSRGYMYIGSGGTALLIKENGGYVNVADGANVTFAANTLSNVVLYHYASATVHSGTIANNTTVKSSGFLYISSGGVANETTVNSWGSLSISSGGVANNTTVNSAGRMYISSGGVANENTVNSRGFMSVSSGGTALLIKENGGYVDVAEGANVTFAANTFSNVLLSYGCSATVHSGTVANNTTISSGGNLCIYSGGVVNNTTVYYGGSMAISSGVVANDTTLNSGVSMSISSGGTANGITICDRGRVYLSGGSANHVTVSSGGYLDVYPGGIANSTVIDSYGCAWIRSDGTANNTEINGWNGVMHVYQGGTANSTTIHSGGSMFLSTGGVANSTTVNSGGSVSVLSGGCVNNATIAEAGSMYVSAGGSAAGVSGEFFAGSGATVNGILYERDFVVGKVFSSSIFYEGGGEYWLKEDNYLHAQVLSGASVWVEDSIYFENTVIHSGGFMEFRDDSQEWFGMPELGKYERTEFNSLTVKKGGEFAMCNHGLVSNGNIQGILSMDSRSLLQNTIIHSGGIAYLSNRTKGSGLTIGSGGNLYIGMSAEGHNITIDGGMVHVATGGILADVTISEDGGLYVYGGAVLDGEINVNGTMYLDDDTMNNGNVNFVLSQSDAAPLLNDLSRLTGGSCSVTVETNEAGQYQLAGNADGFTGSIEMRDRDGVSAGVLTTEGFITVDDTLYTLSNSDGILSIEAMIQAYKKSIHWVENGAAESYIVEYSTDNFANVFRVTVNSNTLDNYLPAAGSYQWRVSFDGTTWINGEQIVANASADQEKVFSDADGDMDIFFANASGTWGRSYAAQHLGSLNGWTGTAEQVILKGKNRISDVFEGSADANILVLTDDANGDALFVDDIYTSFGNDAARISRIDEIRAGAGDDMIDMTSQQFAYSGDGVKISGGLGDDTIWANCGSNELYGDAGNDRIVGGTDDDIIIGGIGDDIMHGGGGNDTFCFSGDWGNDVIEQLSGGTVTLWFKNGSEANWDADTLTYTGGLNSIRISGVDADQVELKFGYIGDAPAGAFADFSGGKIFEDQAAGILA